MERTLTQRCDDLARGRHFRFHVLAAETREYDALWGERFLWGDELRWELVRGFHTAPEARELVSFLENHFGDRVEVYLKDTKEATA